MMKLFAGLLVLAALAMGAAMVIGGRVPSLDRAPPPMAATPAPTPTASPAAAASVATAAVSPTDTFTIHEAPPAAPNAAPATPAAPAPDALGAAIDRLRTNPQPDATMTVTAPPAPATPVTPAPDVLAGPNPAPNVLAGPATPPPPPAPSWTSVTSQGVRWHGNPTSLQIDMGGSRVATVQVDPAFANLPQEAANMRVDYIKQTILENFPSWATQFRFARDGSVALLR